ncbi:hypothetical protein FRC12_005041 [Ceratobasidium sp. 428]|nr:hypothetical protein FRC12_005041 [Ceratobasidium sp. 428]
MTDSVPNSVAASLHCIEPLRGTDNYNVWRIQMEDILTDLDLYGYVNRTKLLPARTVELTISNRKDSAGKPLPEETQTVENEDYSKWLKSNRKALSNI